MLSAKQQPSNIKHDGAIRPNVCKLTFGPPCIYPEKFKQLKLITSARIYNRKKTSRLQISDVVSSDDATYTCSVTVRNNTDRATASITGQFKSTSAYRVPNTLHQPSVFKASSIK